MPEPFSARIFCWASKYVVENATSCLRAQVIEYVRNQRELHAQGKFVDRLERVTQPEPPAEAEGRE